MLWKATHAVYAVKKKEKGISAVAWSWKDSVSHYTKSILTNLGFTASPNSKIKYKVRRK